MKKQFEDNKERKPAGVFITVWPCYRLEATALDLVLLVILYFTILAILKNQKALTSCNPKAIAWRGYRKVHNLAEEISQQILTSLVQWLLLVSSYYTLCYCTCHFKPVNTETNLYEEGIAGR